MTEHLTPLPASVAATDDRPAWVRLVEGGSAGGRAARRPPPTTRRVLAQFIAANLLAVVLILAGSIWASGRAAANESLSGARTTADVLATTLIEPALTDGVLTGDPDALAALDRAAESARRNSPLVRIKLWDATGRIVWSDEPRLIGEPFGLDDDERDALRDGNTLAEVSDLSAPENRYERPLGELLEVYRGIETPSGEPLLFETYLHYEDITARQREILLTFAPISITALMLLLLLQLPLGDRTVRKLREGEAERLALQARAVDASIDERRRIAGTLHDGIAQDLAAATYVLSGAIDQLAAGRLNEDEAAGVTARLRAAEGAVRDSMAALRSLLIEIYPPQLAQAGLPSALHGLADRLQRGDVQMHLDVSDDIEVPPETAALLFRVAQEALINVGRHAGAGEVTLRLWQERDRVVLEVTDDGVGFDPSATNGAGHFGLRVLTDLAAAAGATLDLSTAPGRGTALRLEVPLP